MATATAAAVVAGSAALLLICTFCIVYANNPQSAAAASFPSSPCDSTRALSTATSTAGDKHVALRVGSPDARINVEIFLDLACPISAAAWPELKQVVEDNMSWTNFVFRIHPMPHHQNAFEAAKALLAVRYHAINGGGGGEGCEGVLEKITSFINHVFDGQDLILNDATEDLIRLDIHQILGGWARSSGSMTIGDFNSAFVDVNFEKWATQEFESACARGVANAPVAVINGVTIDLGDENGMEEFRHILDRQISIWVSNDDDFLWMGSLSLRGWK